jgi:hypothetical protein
MNAIHTNICRAIFISLVSGIRIKYINLRLYGHIFVFIFETNLGVHNYASDTVLSPLQLNQLACLKSW